MEKWGEAALRKYKKTPWVMRRFNIEEIKTKSLVRISLGIEYEKFDTKEKNLLIHALANFLDISPDEISIEMIEEGSTKISLKLPKESGDKLMRYSREEIADVLKDIGDVLYMEDMYQSCKRIISFKIFDTLLDSCMAAICPKIIPYFHQYLTDISVEGYIRERAYLYYMDGIGKDDKERYFLAAQRGARMFECPVKKPTLDKEVFEIESNSFNVQANYDGAIRRKAFWRYMSRKTAGSEDDPINNHVIANEFVYSMKGFYAKTKYVEDKIDLEKIQRLRGLLEENLNIANALDMYKYCYFRQCVKESSEECSDKLATARYGKHTE
jgi:hypothetical protein